MPRGRREIRRAKEDRLQARNGQDIINFGHGFARFDQRDQQRLFIRIANIFLKAQSPRKGAIPTYATNASRRVAPKADRRL